MNRLFFWCALIASCELRTPSTLSNTPDTLPATQDVSWVEVSSIIPRSAPVLRETSTTFASMLPCATDNPCLTASIDYETGACILKTIDQQGDVYCDDHNPCTENDSCYGDYCLGDVIDGCDLDDTYYY